MGIQELGVCKYGCATMGVAVGEYSVYVCINRVCVCVKHLCVWAAAFVFLPCGDYIDCTAGFFSLLSISLCLVSLIGRVLTVV